MKITPSIYWLRKSAPITDDCRQMLEDIHKVEPLPLLFDENLARIIANRMDDEIMKAAGWSIRNAR